jgi:hypothetical protein
MGTRRRDAAGLAGARPRRRGYEELDHSDGEERWSDAAERELLEEAPIFL